MRCTRKLFSRDEIWLGQALLAEKRRESLHGDWGCYHNCLWKKWNFLHYSVILLHCPAALLSKCAKRGRRHGTLSLHIHASTGPSNSSKLSGSSIGAHNRETGSPVLVGDFQPLLVQLLLPNWAAGGKWLGKLGVSQHCLMPWYHLNPDVEVTSSCEMTV